MKKVLITLFIFIWQFSYSQSGIITYRAKSLLKSENNPQHDRELKAEMDLMRFTLKYSGYDSYFRKEKNIPIDQFKQGMVMIFIKSNINWYQNIIKKEAVYNLEIRSDMHVVEDNRLNQGWELKNNSKIIGGYTCFEARKKILLKKTKGYRYITAWFTSDIPVAFGPIGSGGLPGLILQLEVSDRVIYTVDKIILNPKRKVKFPKLKKGKRITIEERAILMRKTRKVTKD